MATNIIEIRNSLVGGGTPAMAGGGSGEGSSSSGGMKKTMNDFGKKYLGTKSFKSLGKTLGISFSIGTILKQSQVFTSMFGTMFQIVGALADIVFAPLAKHLAPLMGTFATLAVNKAQNLSGKFEKVLNWLFDDGMFNLEYLWKTAQMISDMLQNPLKIAWDMIFHPDRFVSLYNETERRFNGWWNPMWITIKKFFSDLFDPIISWIKNKMGIIDSVVEAPKNTWNKIADAAGKIGNLFTGGSKAITIPVRKSPLSNIPINPLSEGQTEMFSERMVLEGWLANAASRSGYEYRNQMDMTDQQLREHAKTDFDSMLAYRQNSSTNIGYSSGNNAM